MSTEAPIALKQFLIRAWIWHFAVTSTFFVLLVLIVRPHYAELKGTHQDLIINLVCLLLCVVHTVLILIISMRRFSRKQHMPGLIYLVHFFLSASLGYYAGLLFSGGVIQEVIPG